MISLSHQYVFAAMSLFTFLPLSDMGVKIFSGGVRPAVRASFLLSDARFWFRNHRTLGRITYGGCNTCTPWKAVL